MSHAGDELHHFGWNACILLCPYAPHPHMERRYLVVRDQFIRIHIPRPNGPRQPKIVKVIEPETLASGRATPHRTRCTADRTAVPECVGCADGNGPGGSSFWI